jgi:tRNA-specific 2-thiouridylase
VQIRYRFNPVPVTVILLEDSRVRLVFDEPQFSIIPGQAAVWYDGDKVLGGGITEQFR